MALRLRLLAWLLLIAALALLWWQDDLRAWSVGQLAAQAAGPPLPPPILVAARAIQDLLRPPAYGRIVIGVLVALGILGMELALLLALPALRAHNERRAARAFLRVRTLPLTSDASADADLLRSLHALLPVNPMDALFGRAPWLTLTLHGQPGAPVTLGIALSAPTAAQLHTLVAAVRAAITGHAPDALVEVVDDPLASTPPARGTLAWCRFRLSGPPELPLRTLADAASDPLGPLASALRPTMDGSTELHLALRPLRGWELRTGWRAAGLRRLLRLQQKADHALAPDARRLESRLAAPAFAAELRLVVLAYGRDGAPQAAALAQRVTDALAVLAERTGPWRQAIVGAGSGRTPAGTRAAQRAWQRLATRTPAIPSLPRLLLPLPTARPALVLTVDELVGFWHRPTVALGDLVAALPNRHLPAPIAAFLPAIQAMAPYRDAWLALGQALRPDGALGEVGVTLRDLRHILHLTAGMGAGKSRLLANLCRQFLTNGYCLIDGKGDDAGGLSSFVIQLIPLADEHRVILLDPRDARWPVGMNPLAGLDLQQPGAIDLAVANVFALFARIDPETWGGAQGMRDFLDKALRLVLDSEPHPTLANVKQALLDESYRAALLEHCQNRDVTDYWTVVFPRIGEGQKSSRDALLRRFDKLLSADLLRLMLNRPDPALDLGQAIATRQIVLMPIPTVALGDLAGVYAMLLLQQFLRAAFARPGDDQSRIDFALMIDEVQVLIAEAANEDLEVAFSQLRAFAILLIIAHQALVQLGKLEPLVHINAENRIILKTREPDASIYARQYGHAGLTASDISNQDPHAHQYAVLRCAGQPAGPFSMAPLPWPQPLEEPLPAYVGPPWQEVPPSGTAHAQAYQDVARFIYADVPSAELNRRAEELAHMSDDLFALTMEGWAAIRDAHLAHIARHPGCIPDKAERMRWRSRLRYGLPYVLAEAIYRRARPAVAPESPATGKRRGGGAASAAAPGAPTAAPPEPPAFTQADREPPAAPPRSGPLFPEADDDS